MKYTIEQRIKDEEYDKIINFRDYDTEVLYDDNTEEYFDDIDEMEEIYKFRNLEMPKYAYGCEFTPVKIDINWILECACDDHADGVMDKLEGVKDLEDAIDTFNATNKEAMVGSYYEDLRTIVELF